ncbi:hypothetical protein CRG98_030991 [Punica granatum]|uniref:Uncharacterized protein n=1 Tax=Punica granatum TaxID=22663 RepID=A0A2I0IYW1_PUNGR|nr:hypothetical protein CRG98_030991 [Punica granatum]
MATEATTAFKVMNREFVKLDRFDGSNFNRWKDKMLLLLTVLNVAYVLDPNLQPLEDPAPDATPEEIAKVAELKKKREEDKFTCRGHILNTLSDRLYDLYMSMQSPMEIWKTLEEKYNTERQDTNKFLMMKYFEFKMLDSVLIMDQVHELQILVSRFRDLKVIISKSLQVGTIISKLLSSWNDYRKKLLYMAEDFIVEKILRHLRIEEETRKRDAVYLPQGSKVNHVSESKNSQKGIESLEVGMITELNIAMTDRSYNWWSTPELLSMCVTTGNNSRAMNQWQTARCLWATINRSRCSVKGR